LLLLGVAVLSRVLADHPGLRQRLVAAIVPQALRSTVEHSLATLPASTVPFVASLIGRNHPGKGDAASAELEKAARVTVRDPRLGSAPMMPATSNPAKSARGGPGDLHLHHRGAPAGPLRDRREPPDADPGDRGGRRGLLTFVFTTLIHEPASIVTLAGILLLSVALDYGWKHFRDTRMKNVQLARQASRCGAGEPQYFRLLSRELR
jgi:hypothetical protein